MLQKKHFSDSYRLEILNDYLFSSSSKYSIEKKYSLSRGSIYRWLRIFALPDRNHPIEMANQEQEHNQVPCVEELTCLKLRIKELESALKQARMARDAYDCMIDLAEEKYHIQVRKNSDAK